jgi:hypothetical protein
MEPKSLDDMTLEELVAENNRLWAIRQEAKAQQSALQPYLDKANKAEEAASAKKADPSLTQGIG